MKEILKENEELKKKLESLGALQSRAPNMASSSASNELQGLAFPNNVAI
jgi:hypothetical protein